MFQWSFSPSLCVTVACTWYHFDPYSLYFLPLSLWTTINYDCIIAKEFGALDGEMGRWQSFMCWFFRTQTKIPLFCQQFLMRKMSKDSGRMLDSLSYLHSSWDGKKVGRTTTKNKRATNWKKKSYNFFFCLVQVQFQFFRSREKFFNFNHHELQVEQKSLNILQESAETWTRGKRKFEFQRRRWSEACKKGLSMSNVVERCAAMWMSSEQLDSESFLGQETRYANYHQRTLDIQLLYYNRYTISDIGEKTSTTPLRYQRQLDANVRRKFSQSMWRAEWAEGRWSQVDNNRFSPHKFAFCRV